MSRVLVAEKLAEAGIEAMRAAGHDVDVRLDLDAAELIDAVQGAEALVIRSSTQVTAEVLDAGTDLVVVGRAGIGLDNVDIARATERGVMVVNAPESNTISAAEHTMALLLAQARNVPQAHTALIDGRWERARWMGAELSEKTLGIVGLGRIGTLVAGRAKAFGMHVIAHDPFVSPDRAHRIDVDLVELDELVARADFMTLHLARTPDTVGLVGRNLLARAKPGLRVINVSRGGVVDEEALAEAISGGQIAGAAIDVFETEPCTDSPLFGLPGVVVTPHLGASTTEAQDKAGLTIAEQVVLALAGELVPLAVNVDAGSVSEVVRPFLPLADQLGALFASLVGHLPDQLDIEFRGAVSNEDTTLIRLCVVRGLLTSTTDVPVSYVNAMALASSRGMEVRTISVAAPRDYLNVITLRGAGRSLGGTLFGLEAEPRLVDIDGATVDLRPSRHMIVIRGVDQPGMIGMVGTTLGEDGVNIVDMHLGQSSVGAPELMVIATSRPVTAELRDELMGQPGVESVRVLDRA